MNAYQLHLEARRTRAALQSELLTKLGAMLIERAHRGWARLTVAYRRRPRVRVSEAPSACPNA